MASILGERRRDPATGGPAVSLIGFFPPVLTGQAVANEAIARALEEGGVRVERLPVDGRSSGAGGASRFARAAAYLRAYLRLARSGPADGCVYISLEANAGKALSLPTILLAHLSRRGLVIHHHAYSYIRHPTLLGRLVAYSAKGAVHVFQCARMADDFHRAYGPPARTLTLDNSFMVTDGGVVARSPSPALRLGFMGAVTEDKGVFRALELARELVARGRRAELHVAGAADEAVRSRLAQEARAAGVPLRLHGVVDVAGKRAFFEQVDVFAFPSTYRNETQGIVNLEALCAGRPIVAIGQCCVAETILPLGGVVINEPLAFIDNAAAAVEKWLASEATWMSASQDARRQFERECDRSREQLGVLCECISKA